jgi:inorganic pyrophosphatase
MVSQTPPASSPFDADGKKLLRVVIETPKGSRNKFAFGPDDRIFELNLGKAFCRELEEFFVSYHKVSGEKYRVLGVKGPDQGRKLVKSGMR